MQQVNAGPLRLGELQRGNVFQVELRPRHDDPFGKCEQRLGVFAFEAGDEEAEKAANKVA